MEINAVFPSIAPERLLLIDSGASEKPATGDAAEETPPVSSAPIVFSLSLFDCLMCYLLFYARTLSSSSESMCLEVSGRSKALPVICLYFSYFIGLSSCLLSYRPLLYNIDEQAILFSIREAQASVSFLVGKWCA